MSAFNPGFLPADNLPSQETIVALCKAAGHKCRGIPLRNEPSGPIVAWVKYGLSVTVATALTQDWVAKYLIANPASGVSVPRVFMAFTVDAPRCFTAGYIVMEYIDGVDCDKNDVALVAAAVQTLINVPAPDSQVAPGPVGGGRIIHSFFVHETSSIAYDNVEELQQHINGILAYKKDRRRVNLVAAAANGLRLCVCDIRPRKFKKLPDGKVAAFDFEANCFLPPLFTAVAMADARDDFHYQVAKRISYPKSDDLDAILTASYFLVPFMSNNLGIPSSLRRRKGL